MLKNFIKIAWRNLYKKKLFSFIHIIGLTIGITVCMMIFLYIMNEFSVDNFHKQGKNIYRVMRRFDVNKNMVPYLSGPYGPALLNDYPKEIKEAVRVMPNSGLITLKNNTSFNEKKIYLADNGFFNLFSFPLVKGNPATALKDPLSIVISESTAKKYFGNADPIGQVVSFDKDLQLKVTGVSKDVPSNSHMDFDMVIPMSNYAQYDWFNVWRNNNQFVYARIDNPADVAALEKQFPAFMEKYMGADMKKMGVTFALFLRPLKDIYFEPSSEFDNVRHGDKSVVYIFLSIAALILIIACINFMNLSTIRAVERSKEVGLRKVMALCATIWYGNL